MRSIVGASTLKSGGPMGEVNLERSLDSRWSVPGARRSASCQGAVWSCVEPYENGACGGVGCTIPQSACTLS